MHNENLECEAVSLRKELEKVKTMNLRFSKGSETLDEIIKLQFSPLMKKGIGYIGETSQIEKSLATIRSKASVMQKKPISKASILSKRIKAFHR